MNVLTKIRIVQKKEFMPIEMRYLMVNVRYPIKEIITLCYSELPFSFIFILFKKF